MSYKLENPESLVTSFDKLEKKSGLFFRDDKSLITKYYKNINQALNKGYSFDELIDLVFSPNGINITSKILEKEFNNLKHKYLNRPKNKSNSKNL